jgi:hypothetical protein
MTTLLCCLVAFVLAASLFVEPIMAKLAGFVTHRPVAAGVASVLLALVTFAVPYVLLSSN